MTSPTPQTMRAWAYSRTGPYRQTLSLVTSHPYPTFPPDPPSSNEEYLLVNVSHTALNPGDAVALRSMPWFLHSTKTAVPCFDLTGTVISTHNSPSRFAPGDKIIGFPPLSFLLKTGSGGLQEVISLPAKYCVPLPPTQTLLSGAGLFLTALTANLQVREAGIKKGDRVLVIGASGGCGTMAVQLARSVIGKDGYIAAVCSGRNQEMVKSLGCDEVIDYTRFPNLLLPAELAKRFNNSGDGQQKQQQFDAVIDAYGNQSLYVNCRHFLKPGGVYSAVSIHSESYAGWDLLKSGWAIIKNVLWPRATWLGGTGRTFKIASMMDPGLGEMEELNALFAEGKLKVVRDSVWGFDQVHGALDKLCSGHAAGKVVIKVGDDDEE
ncbi:putative dehydrogenase [Cladorrhinum sp. PSN332]|nr:putative dehydrogenase [Cladorrhinum sp. PSN332]